MTFLHLFEAYYSLEFGKILGFGLSKEDRPIWQLAVTGKEIYDIFIYDINIYYNPGTT
jgi:hypothetical protein